MVSAYSIAEAKAHLSALLEQVARGEPVTLTKRGKPVARIVPYAASGRELTIRKPRAGATKPGKVALPPPLGLKRDVVKLLLAERQTDR